MSSAAIARYIQPLPRQSVPRRADTHRARERMRAGSASSNGRSVSNLPPTVLGPLVPVLMIPLGVNFRGEYITESARLKGSSLGQRG